MFATASPRPRQHLARTACRYWAQLPNENVHQHLILLKLSQTFWFFSFYFQFFGVAVATHVSRWCRDGDTCFAVASRWRNMCRGGVAVAKLFSATRRCSSQRRRRDSSETSRVPRSGIGPGTGSSPRQIDENFESIIKNWISHITFKNTASRGLHV